MERAGSSRVENGLDRRQQRETKPEQSTPAAKRLAAASPAACFSGVPMSPAAAGAPPLAAFGELPRGVEPAPFVRHAGGTRAGAPPRAGMASGCGGVRRVYPDAVLVRPVADVPGRAPPGHGSIGPAGFQGFTAGDGRSGRQDFRRAGNTGPQAGGEGEQRQGVGHGLHV